MSAGERFLLGVCMCLCMSVYIYCFCQSQLTGRTSPFPQPFLLGLIICWLAPNWLRTVIFGSGGVHRDFGVCRGRGVDQVLWVQVGNLELSHREWFLHSVFVDLDLFFTLCILFVVVPTYLVTQVFISSLIQSPAFNQLYGSGKIPSFWASVSLVVK